jgi:hypothetical protein
LFAKRLLEKVDGDQTKIRQSSCGDEGKGRRKGEVGASQEELHPVASLLGNSFQGNEGSTGARVGQIWGGVGWGGVGGTMELT